MEKSPSAVDRDLHQVSPRNPNDLRPHAAQHRRLLHTDHLHDQLHRFDCKADAILGVVDRHKLPAGLGAFDFDLGALSYRIGRKPLLLLPPAAISSSPIRFS